MASFYFSDIPKVYEIHFGAHVAQVVGHCLVMKEIMHLPKLLGCLHCRLCCTKYSAFLPDSRHKDSTPVTKAKAKKENLAILI